MSNTARLTLPAQTIDTTDGVGRSLLENAKAQMGVIPNMYANMVSSPGCWKPICWDTSAFGKMEASRRLNRCACWRCFPL